MGGLNPFKQRRQHLMEVRICTWNSCHFDILPSMRSTGPGIPNPLRHYAALVLQADCENNYFY